jgi:hypothetical protein
MSRRGQLFFCRRSFTEIIALWMAAVAGEEPKEAAIDQLFKRMRS